MSGMRHDAATGGSDNSSLLPTAAIVLAAGKSSRMKSKTPKTLHPVCGKPLLLHILDALQAANVTRRVVVVGHQADMVRTVLDNRYGSHTIEYATQTEQQGTGHAVRITQSLFTGYEGTVLVLPGDAPLLSADVLKDLLETHAEAGNAATILTAVLPDAGSYGRIVRDGSGGVTGIVEAKDTTPDQKLIREINAGVYAFHAPTLFAALAELKPANAQNEYYLTDVIQILRNRGKTVGAVVSPNPDVVKGVNTRVELAEISQILRHQLLRDLMLSGVTILDPATTYVEAGVSVGPDTVIYPNTHLLGRTVVGEDCIIGPNAHILHAQLGDRVRARACFVEESTVGDGCKIGPFAHVRPGSVLEKNVRVGNFVETKAAVLHENVAVGHLSYIGDAEVGADTNIGAGTITCNYDGEAKHRTIIGADVFVGSHTAFVAPVTIGDGAATAAGSTITRDVPPGSLAVARERQTIKEGWADARRRRRVRAAKEPDAP